MSLFSALGPARRLVALLATASVLVSLSLVPHASAQEAGPPAAVVSAEWKPAEGRLMTKWAADVSPANALPDYPRPQLVRENWHNLNGLWDYRIESTDGAPLEGRSGKILVPYPLESALSGVMGKLLPSERLVYERDFVLPANLYDISSDGSVATSTFRLHFGAVDWECEVYLDDELLGTHRGGFDPFWFDVPVAKLANRAMDAPHRLKVVVWDPSDTGYQPVGKQSLNPHGIWYTAVSGIWQTVWIEPLNEVAVDSVDVVVVDAKQGIVRLTPRLSGSVDESTSVQIAVTRLASLGHEQELSPSIVATAKAGESILVSVDDPHLWSPDEPWLYFAGVSVVGDVGGHPAIRDAATIYFGLRDVKMAQAADGHPRMFLNGEPLFQFGPLDQGWWPDGLYTAPTDEALRYDVEMTKKLGFNMARKHVKVEPARWYWWCDRLGLLVWQDMPSGDKKINVHDPDIDRTAQSERTYRQEWKRIIEALDHSPSIVVWVPFNEGWGQFKTNEILAWTKSLDPTRLVDGPSGWQDRGEGDLLDAHIYPGPGAPPPQSGRVSVLGEFGGLGLPLDGHLWVPKNNWGYRTYTTSEELESNYVRTIEGLRPLIGQGLAAAVYTQTTDVEIEVNGLMTYDRAVVKVPESVRDLHAKLYLPPPKIDAVLASSRTKPQTWSFTTDETPANWFAVDFDASSWKTGPGGFGTDVTPNAVVGTEWKTPTIRLRKTFKVDELPQGKLAVRMFHDEDAIVYVNGKEVLAVKEYVDNYRTFVTEFEAKDVLRQGENVVAVECRQTRGGQFIDVGLDVIGSE